MSGDAVYLGMVAAALQPQPWMDDAACVDSDPELWFGDETDRYPNQAKQLCAGCPVVAECLTYGMDEPYGIYAGLTPNERARLRGGRATARTVDSDYLGRKVSRRTLERRRAAQRQAAS